MKKLFLPLTITLSFASAAIAGEGVDKQDHKSDLDQETAAIVFDNLDRNGDGSLDADEAAKLENIAPLYVEIDSDSDGNIARDEFVAMSNWEGELNDERTALMVEVDSHLTADSETTAFNEPAEDPLDYDADWQDVNQDDPEASAEVDAELDGGLNDEGADDGR